VGTSFYDLLYEYFDWVAGVIVVGGLMLAGASLIGLGAVALAVAVPWRRGGVPRCGKCAYPVSGVQSWSCPECGGDYHSMGIIAPHHRRLIHPMVTVPLFSIFLVAPATVVALIAIAVGPQHVTYTDNVGLTPKEAAGYEQVQLYARSARGSAKHTAVALEVHIETPATWYLYEVDFGTMMYVDSDYATGTSAVPPQPFDRAGLEQMFQTAGVDTTQPLFKRQMDELWPIIQDAPGIGQGHAVLQRDRHAGPVGRARQVEVQEPVLGELAVGDHHRHVVERDHARRAPVHLHHAAGRALHLHPVSDAEGVLDVERDAAEEIADHALQRKAQHHADHA